MYQRVISKIQEEINQKQNLINNIENFDCLDLIGKLNILKESSLKSEKQELAKLIQQDFKSDILRNSNSCHVGINRLYIQHDIFVFKVYLDNSNIIEIETEQKIIDERKLKDKIVTREERLFFDDLNSFINKPTFKGYKKLSPKFKENCSMKNSNYYLHNKKTIKILEETLTNMRDYIQYQEKQHMINEQIIINNNELKAVCDNYLLQIEEDLNYFKEKNYKLILKFNK